MFFLDFHRRFLYIIKEQTAIESNLYSSFYKLVASIPKCALPQTCETVDKSSKSIHCYIDSVYQIFSGERYFHTVLYRDQRKPGQTDLRFFRGFYDKQRIPVRSDEGADLRGAAEIQTDARRSVRRAGSQTRAR